jgi:hypothetical protein
MDERPSEREMRFSGGDEPSDSTLLSYEETLEVLLSLIGRQVLVLFSGASGHPFVIGVLVGRLDRGELDERLQEVLLRADVSPVETLFFHVGSRQSGFVLRPDDFVRAFKQTAKHLTMHLGNCAVTVFTQGDLDEVMKREPRTAGA